MINSFKSIRYLTEELCKPLETEDYVVQTIGDVSPPKWHLGHTSWFFETFILQKFKPNYNLFNDTFNFIFNSYYESIGHRVKREKRGILSRPTVKEVYEYRKYINDQIIELIETTNDEIQIQIANIVELGLNHEQQHQELLLTDIKNIFACNLLKPVYSKSNSVPALLSKLTKSEYIAFEEGIYKVGHNGNSFAFDNESPRHKVFIKGFILQNRLVTNGEYLEFIEDGGYFDHRLWLSDGWEIVHHENWTCPLYWEKRDNKWFNMTLSGMQKLNLYEPVCHISYYEADAYSKWSNKRLPTEWEWEVAASVFTGENKNDNFLENKYFHPIPLQKSERKLQQMFGNVWEWTQSAYLAYPGYNQPNGVFGEYNGKFMSNQMVLRGGSCVTPINHIRVSYRNFLQCDKRWQFTGLRLAADV